MTTLLPAAPHSDIPHISRRASLRSWWLSCVAACTFLTAACSDGVVQDASAPPPPIPSAPTGITLTHSAKSLEFSWVAPAHASFYRLLEDLDGTGPLPSTVVGTASTAAFNYSIPEFLLTRLNASYTVQACNVSGCSTNSAPVQAQINQAIGYFKASNAGTSDIYGTAIALSADGQTLAVGAYAEASAAGNSPADNSAPNAGAVYVYSKSQGKWAQQAMLKAPNAAAQHFFGKSIALSADGNTLAIGADGEGSNHTGTFAVMPAGNALAPDSGAVYVYARAGNTWAQQAYIKAANAEAFDIFGFAVALSADGNSLAVGAWYESGAGTGTTADPSDNSGFARGAAYVFMRSGSNWTQTAYIKATNSGDGDWFGLSLALSADGNTLAVGAMNESRSAENAPTDPSTQNSGAVYVYTRAAGVWTPQAYLKAPVPEANDNFGVYLALSGNGNTLAIGMHGDDSNLTGTFSIMPADNNLASNSGAVFVFTRAGSTWTQQAYLKASNVNPSTPARFGRRFALSDSGNILAVAAYREDGAGLGFFGDPSSTAAIDAGAVYLYDRSGTAWAQRSYLKASNTNARDRFGSALAMTPDGRTLAVGAEGESSSATGVGGNQADNSILRSGAAYLY
jgi:trimeric autotransporter adhesin